MAATAGTQTSSRFVQANKVSAELTIFHLFFYKLVSIWPCAQNAPLTLFTRNLTTSSIFIGDIFHF